MPDKFLREPMLLAFFVVIATGLWLVAVACLMALRPHYSLRLLERMSANLSAFNWRLNLTEQGLRLLAGAALIVHSAASKLPQVFAIAGWFVVLSSILILLIPIRWSVVVPTVNTLLHPRTLSDTGDCGYRVDLRRLLDADRQPVLLASAWRDG